MTIDTNFQTENPSRTSAKFTAFTTYDRLVFWSLVAVDVVIWSATSLLVAVICFFILMIPMLHAENGRLYRLAIRGFRSWRIRRRSHVTWQPEQQTDNRGKRRKRRLREILKTFGLGPMGVMHYPAGRSDSIVIVGDGSVMASQDLPEQAQSHMEYADFIKRVASTARKYAVGVSSIFQRRPPDLLKYQRNSEGHLHPEVAYPEALLKDESEWTEHDHRMMALYRIQAELEEVYEATACSITMAICLTVRHDTVLSTAFKNKRLAIRKVPRLVLSRIAYAAIKGLTRFGATGLRILDKDGIEDFIREGWDVADIEEYRNETALRREQRDNGDDAASDDLFWPGEVKEAYEDYCVTDNTYHTIFRMTTGKPFLTIGEMRQLYAVDVPWVTITLVGETVSSRREYGMFNFVLHLLDDTKEVTGFLGGRGARAERKERTRQQRLEAIDASGFIQDYNILAVVSATNLDDLEDWAGKMQSHCDYLGLGPVRVEGEDFQEPALVSALTGVNML